MTTAYTAHATRRIVGVSQRCLDYWDEKGIVRPTVRQGAGKGSERRYSFHDLLRLSIVKQLRASGLSLQKIQKGLKVLKKRAISADPLVDLTLVTDGKRLHRLTKDPSVLEDVLGNGQLVFSVVAVGRIEEGLRDRVLRLEKELQRRVRGRPRSTARSRRAGR